MADRIDLENAIITAEGAAAVVEVLQERFFTEQHRGLASLGIELPCQIPSHQHVYVITVTEHETWDHALTALVAAVNEAGRIFERLPVAQMK